MCPIQSLTQSFPAEWRCIVTVERPSAGQWGIPGAVSSHAVPDCMVAVARSAEDVPSRSLDPDTTAVLVGPVGGDFASIDVVVVPGPEGTTVTLSDGSTLVGSGPAIRPWGRFRVTGEPDFKPLGVYVQLGSEVVT